ncbi:hypothetical protein FPV67DRAFT_1476438, partial [Lyophyllum atratum]
MDLSWLPLVLLLQNLLHIHRRATDFHSLYAPMCLLHLHRLCHQHHPQPIEFIFRRSLVSSPLGKKIETDTSNLLPLFLPHLYQSAHKSSFFLALLAVWQVWEQTRF